MSFMSGDTFIEVAASLARTNVSDPVSFGLALESVKRYVRAKIKKGKGKEVSAPGGKLEQLEAKYAHLGYQDIFYLTRLHLGIPPSALALALPPPTSSTRKILVQAKYPLPPIVQLDSPSHPSTPSLSPSGRDSSVRDSTWSEQSGSGSSTSRVTIATPILEEQALPVIAPIPIPAPVAIPQQQQPEEDQFDDLTTEAIQPTRHLYGNPRQSAGVRPYSGASPVLRPASAGSSVYANSPLGEMSPLARQLSGSSSAARSPSLGSRPASRGQPQRVVSGDEADVRRMLQARIDALQNALNTLDVDDDLPIPAPVPVSANLSRGLSSSSVRNRMLAFPLPPSPPPTIPLPPLPLPMPANPLTAPVRQSNPAKRPPSHQVRLPAIPQQTGVMFDLDPEFAKDPFAAPPSPVSPGYVSPIRDGLKRVRSDRVEGRLTPPPRYAEGPGMRSYEGRAI